MAAWTIIAWAAAAWWLTSVAVFAASLFGALLQPRIQRRRARKRKADSRTHAPVSLVLPVKLLNPGFERAQESAFIQDHPDYEVLIGAMEEDSLALSAMRTLAARHRNAARFVRAHPRGSISPKLDTLAAPIEAAANEVIVTKDSNITFAPDTLRALVRSLTQDVGLVCAVPVAVRAQRLAGKIEAILINRDARLLLTASAAGKGYGVGKATVFRRGDLAKIGSIEAIAYTIAEDTALSRALGAIGLRTVFADATVEQEIGARRLAEVYGRQRRWAVIRRAEEPLTFTFEPVASPLPAAFAGAVAAPLIGWAPLAAFGITLAGWYAIEVAVTALKGWELRPWTPLAFLGRDAILLAAWARAWTTREVTWAGGKQDVRDVLRRPKRTQSTP